MVRAVDSIVTSMAYHASTMQTRSVGAAARSISARTQADKRRKKTALNGKRAWGDAIPTSAESASLKRASIVREAARAFNRAGFHGTSMDDIARQVGVSKAALYRYVRTKHEVLFTCFSLGLDSGEANLDRAEREGANGLEKLRIACRGYLQDVLTVLGHSVVLLEENALLPKQASIVIRRRDGIEKRFRALVAEGIEDGSVIECDPKLAIFNLLGAINWVPKWYRDDGHWSAVEVAESLVDLAIRSIAVDARTHAAASKNISRRSGTRNQKETKS